MVADSVGVDWVSLAEVCSKYGVTYRVALRKVASGAFPVPTYKVGKKTVIDRKVHEQYFKMVGMSNICQGHCGHLKMPDSAILDEVNDLARKLYAVHSSCDVSDIRFEHAQTVLGRFCWNIAVVTYYNEMLKETEDNEQVSIIFSRAAIANGLASKLLH